MKLRFGHYKLESGSRTRPEPPGVREEDEEIGD